MDVAVSPGALQLIQRRGGHVFVWASGRACCGGTRFIKASLDPPRDLRGFERVRTKDFALFIRPAGHLPDELEVGIGGLRHRRVQATWNGCAYLV